jgi:hypothetical protein
MRVVDGDEMVAASHTQAFDGGEAVAASHTIFLSDYNSLARSLQRERERGL